MLNEAVAQLEDELGDLATRIGAVLGTDLQLSIIERAQARASWLVTELEAGQLPDETAADLLALLWPGDPPLDWWRTPLGLLVAPTAAQEPDAPGWTHAQAAVVLGVTRGTIGTMANRGTAERSSDGGISRSWVLARLVRLHRTERAAGSAR